MFVRDRFDFSKFSDTQKKKKRVLERMKRNKLKKEIIEGKKHVSDQFLIDSEIVAMRSIYS